MYETKTEDNSESEKTSNNVKNSLNYSQSSPKPS